MPNYLSFALERDDESLEVVKDHDLERLHVAFEDLLSNQVRQVTAANLVVVQQFSGHCRIRGALLQTFAVDTSPWIILNEIGRAGQEIESVSAVWYCIDPGSLLMG